MMYSLLVPTHTPRTMTTYPIVTWTMGPLAQALTVAGIGRRGRPTKLRTVTLNNPPLSPSSVDNTEARGDGGYSDFASFLVASDGPSRMGRVAIIRDIGA